MSDFRALTGAAPLKQRVALADVPEESGDVRALTGAAPLKPGNPRHRARRVTHFRALTGAAPLKPIANRASLTASSISAPSQARPR